MLSRGHFLGSSLAATAFAASAFAQLGRPKRLIVDAQIHLWKANTPDRPWAPGMQAQLPEPMTIERIVPIMDAGGVDQAVIVPPTLEGWRYDYGQEAARRHPGRFATMARVDLANAKEAERLPLLRKAPHVLGVRLHLGGPLARDFADGKLDWFWPEAVKNDLPVMFLTTGQVHLFAPILEKHPGLKLIIDHMGVSREAVRNNLVGATIEHSAALAKFPSVSCKLSAAPMFSKEPYPFRDVRDHIKRLYDAFGPKRCHWGTDLTASFDRATMKQRVTHFTEELPFLSEEDKDWIMGRSILEKLAWT